MLTVDNGCVRGFMISVVNKTGQILLGAHDRLIERFKWESLSSLVVLVDQPMIFLLKTSVTKAV